ncbi:hypothetical protein MIND_01308600 [Mycena indigotica]|uniref:Uncharacterized protein n=1 Tax=Mycena indigotica TaxID=2126181 RepID=A0A8H6S122_9AGAR|nr:uncharacterized protein MIND_01308600 [Mycena indigotica]KAF7290683.1 hypothetical protein MIND_01308600 [Mycena indigotica]
MSFQSSQTHSPIGQFEAFHAKTSFGVNTRCEVCKNATNNPSIWGPISLVICERRGCQARVPDRLPGFSSVPVDELSRLAFTPFFLRDHRAWYRLSDDKWSFEAMQLGLPHIRQVNCDTAAPSAYDQWREQYLVAREASTERNWKIAQEFCQAEFNRKDDPFALHWQTDVRT